MISSAPDLDHFIDGRRKAGASGRFGDVFHPCLVQARVPLASVGEVEAAVTRAAAAQRGWAAQNPQKRARVLMRFLALVAEEMDTLAALRRQASTAKPSPIRKGIFNVASTWSNSLSASRTCSRASTPKTRAPESTCPRGQPLGVVAGITPFNFPAMIPLWRPRPLGLRQQPSSSNRPSETLPCRCGWPSCSWKRACRRSIQVVNGDRVAVDAILGNTRHPRRRVRRIDADRAIHLETATANGRRAHVSAARKTTPS